MNRQFRPRPNRHNITADTVVWRYLTVEKALDLFTRHDDTLYKIPFTRLDLFNDKQEGRFPTEFVASMVGAFVAHRGWGGDFASEDQSGPDIARTVVSLLKMAESGRLRLAATCWFASNDESAPMWERYAPAGIAIRSNFGKIMNAIDLDDLFGFCGRADYNYQIGNWDPMDAAFAKRVEFEGEKEIRFLVSTIETPMSFLSSGQNPTLPPVKLVNFDLSAIDKIVLGPDCPKWLHRSLEVMIRRSCPNVAIDKAQTGSGPSYLSRVRSTSSQNNNPGMDYDWQPLEQNIRKEISKTVGVKSLINIPDDVLLEQAQSVAQALQEALK